MPTKFYLVLRPVLLACLAISCSQTQSSSSGTASSAPPPSPQVAAAPSPAPKAAAAPSPAPKAAATPAASQKLEDYVTSLLKETGAPGIAVALVRGGKVIWTGARGFADIAAQEPMTAASVWNVASISKTITAAAIMQQYEAGKFQLDGDINADGYLTFKVHNPKFPTQPITYRHLLTHTSGIEDIDHIYDSMRDGDNTDPAVQIEQYLPTYFGGKAPFNVPELWGASAPGKAWDYSNVGATMLALLTEGMLQPNLAARAGSFQAYCNEHIFRKLKMKNTSWSVSGVPRDATFVQNYDFSTGKPVLTRHMGLMATYAAGSLQTSVEDLALFLASMANKGSSDGVQLLKPETIVEMRRSQVASSPAGQGLIWYHFGDASQPDALVGHEGDNEGVSTAYAFRPSDGVGAILFLNAAVGEDVSPALAKTLPQAIFDRRGAVAKLIDLAATIE